MCYGEIVSSSMVKAQAETWCYDCDKKIEANEDHFVQQVEDSVYTHPVCADCEKNRLAWAKDWRNEEFRNKVIFLAVMSIIVLTMVGITLWRVL